MLCRYWVKEQRKRMLLVNPPAMHPGRLRPCVRNTWRPVLAPLLSGSDNDRPTSQQLAAFPGQTSAAMSPSRWKCRSCSGHRTPGCGRPQRQSAQHVPMLISILERRLADFDISFLKTSPTSRRGVGCCVSVASSGTACCGCSGCALVLAAASSARLLGRTGGAAFAGRSCGTAPGASQSAPELGLTLSF